MMLQRAASNAYSWWWASHIRTKQSKWLEQNLQDMEEKVANTLKLIEEDGDSFAKRAEMYYKKRPELINFVEESYRAYRALAERYDHISTELQNANNTIASVFPDQVQFGMDDDDEPDVPRRPNMESYPKSNIPKVPKAPIKDIKTILNVSSGVKKFRGKKGSKVIWEPASKSPAITKPEAMEKIDKLQKDILGLQTVKEFVKSSYEGGLKRYWEIEKQITEMQEEVSGLQDEFGEGVVMEDDEARKVMAAAALKSCQETLADLRERQRRSVEEARKEQGRIKEACRKFESLRKNLRSDEKSGAGFEMSFEEEVEAAELEEEKVKEQFRPGMKEVEEEALTVTEMAEKIDELVNKVIGLETAVASQDALIERLRTEADGLQSQIQLLEGEKPSLVNGGSEGVEARIREMEEKLREVRDLNSNIKAKNIDLQTDFSEADCNRQDLSEKVCSVRPDDNEPEKEAEPTVDRKSGNSVKEPVVLGESRVSDQEKTKIEPNHISEKSIQPQPELGVEERKQNGDIDLMAEYTVTLRNYKEVKRKLDEVETRDRDEVKASDGAAAATQLRELKSENASKDEEIRSLREKLSLLQKFMAETKDSKEESERETSEAPIEVILVDQAARQTSEVEEKLRMDIDQILEENLDFWLRFSAALHQMQKYETAVEDLRAELAKLDEKRKDQSSRSRAFSVNSDVKPIYKHLSEIHTELDGWMEKCVLLKDEQQKRSAALSEVQDEIMKALKSSAEEEDFRFTSYQAAKFQGEVLNMKQENNKVAVEIQAGLDHISVLQLEVGKTMAKLNKEFGLGGPNSPNLPPPQIQHSGSRNRVPLRSFIFGVKQKRSRSSIFTAMSPAMHRKYNGFRSAF